MLALTKKTEYALIALSQLAKRDDGVTSAREIAEATGVSLSILTNILKMLAVAGIVTSERGASGGYVLARRPESINLHELITVVEGPFQLVQCVLTDPETGKSPCELEPTCPIQPPARKIHGRLKTFLESVSLAEIILDEWESSASPRCGVAEPMPLQSVTISEATR